MKVGSVPVPCTVVIGHAPLTVVPHEGADVQRLPVPASHEAAGAAASEPVPESELAPASLVGVTAFPLLDDELQADTARNPTATMEQEIPLKISAFMKEPSRNLSLDE